MKRTKHSTFVLTLALIDMCGTWGAFLASYWLRYHTGLSAPRGVTAFNELVASLLYVTVIWLAVFHALGLYQGAGTRRFSDEFYSVLLAVSFACVGFLAFAFVARAFTYSRGVLAIAWAVNITFVVALRSVAHSWLRGQWRRGLMLRSLWVVGETIDIGELRSQLHPGCGVALAGETQQPHQIDWETADAVLLLDPNLSLSQFRELRGECELRGCELHYVPGPLDLIRARACVEAVGQVEVLTFRAGPSLLWQRTAKRVLDIVVAGLLLLLCALPMLLIALLVRLTSAGPALLAQERVGKHGRRFRMLKFRTMWCDAHQRSGHIQSGSENPNKTPLGVWLRRLSLDELPQFINIIKGEMSLVGPRPEQPHFVEELSSQMPHYRHRHLVPAGLTGWAQVNGLRGGEASMEERLRCDLHYVENWSLLLDVQILVKTAFEFTFHRGAR